MNAGDNGGNQDYESGEDADRDTDRTEKGAASGSKDIENHKNPSSTTKYVGTPINELDLSECTRCTPSYRLLPKDVSATFSFNIILLHCNLLCFLIIIWLVFANAVPS